VIIFICHRSTLRLQHQVAKRQYSDLLFRRSSPFTAQCIGLTWACASCGSIAKTNRRKCRKCGGMRWRLYPRVESREIAGQTKHLNPKGLLLANPGKQLPNIDSEGIECGKCHAIVYSEREFDMAAFKAALKGHYATSPDCAK